MAILAYLRGKDLQPGPATGAWELGIDLGVIGFWRVNWRFASLDQQFHALSPRSSYPY